MDIPGSSRTQKHLMSHLMGLPMACLARHALRPQLGRTSLIQEDEGRTSELCADRNVDILHKEVARTQRAKHSALIRPKKRPNYG